MRVFLRFSLTTKVTVALSIGLGILLVLAGYGLYSAGEFYKAREEVRRLLQVREILDLVSKEIGEAEMVHLRYRVTGNPDDRREFADLSQRAFEGINDLQAMLVLPDQKARLEQLVRAARIHFDLLARRLAVPGAGGPGGTLQYAESSAQTAMRVHSVLGAIGERERRLTTERGAQVDALVSRFVTLAVWSGAIAIALLLWTVFVINRYEFERRRTETELSNARERLAVALEGSRSAAWDWDLPRNEVYLSAAWQQILGAQPQETKVAPAMLMDLVHPADLAHVQAAVKGALGGSTADYREEHRVRRTDGDWVWILSQGKVVRRDAAGRPLRITGINQDVTERKRIELALQEHDLQLQLALATAGMVRWDWDAVADKFVWPEDPWRLAGPAPQGGYLGLQDMVHPEDLVQFIRTLTQAAGSGEPYKDEYRITRTDGKVVWVAARGYAVGDAEGRVVRVIGVAQDVSEIKHAEQALRASERELRLITDAVPAFISYADAEERLQFCNRPLAAFLGAPPAELIGRTLRETYGDEVYGTIRPHVQRALAGEKVRYRRSQTKRAGGVIDLDVTYIPRRGAFGEVEGFYALLTDITELRRLDRMKSEFVSTVSHELRTPLTSIRGSLGILAGGVAGPLSDKVRGFIDIAKENCERLIRLINDILDMEKIESGRMAFQLQELDLMELIGQSVRANEGFAAQHAVRLQIVAARPGTKVLADGDRLAQVMTNLISNACKFSAPEGSVDIAVSEDGERVRVAVSDHGPGISEAFRERIFQKFSQEDSSDMRRKGGTGLGLSITKAIVEGLGGEIGFDTEIGKGSTFYFYLPLSDKTRGSA